MPNTKSLWKRPTLIGCDYRTLCKVLAKRNFHTEYSQLKPSTKAVIRQVAKMAVRKEA